MSNQMEAYDASEDGKVELYLFWYPEGEEVDVAIYIHEVPGGKSARFVELDSKHPVADYAYMFEEAGGSIPTTHTEYFEFTLPGPQQDVIARFDAPGGTVSSANAEAL